MTKKNDIRSKVKELLIERPETRDNDMHLFAAVWYRQLSAKGVDLKNVSALFLLGVMKSYKEHKLFHFESIRRQRALLQEMHPELRGEMYEKRHARQEEIVQDIREYKVESTFAPVTTTEQQPKLF
jgi:hypothetical protein